MMAAAAPAEQRVTLRNFYRILPFHILFFSLYPLLNLYFTNRNQIPLFALLRSLVFVGVLTLVVYLLSWVVMRNVRKAALLTSVFNILFHFYGHLYQTLDQRPLSGLGLARHSLLSVVWVMLGVGAALLIYRLRKNNFQVTGMFNLVGGFLVAIVLGQLLFAALRQDVLREPNEPAAGTGAATGAVTQADAGRDIYYIILDAYTSNEMLTTHLGYDNRPFLNELEKRGFVVVDDARSNYDKTFYSLVSTFNMNYLDALGVTAGMQDFDNLMPQIRDLYPHSRVREILEEQGYATVVFHMKAPWGNLNDADVFYQYEEKVAPIDRIETLLFHDLYLKTTWMRFLYDTQNIKRVAPLLKSPQIIRWIDPNNYGGAIVQDIRFVEYEQNLFALNTLKQVPQIPGKKFVYAHLMVTHSSFVFNEDGSYKREADESNAAYVEQIKFLNPWLLEIVDTILQNSAEPPIIILQGDHGFLSKADRLGILHALYLPEGGADLLYPDITPVNTFRIILDYYFDQDLELLPDRSFYIDTAARKFIEVRR